MDLFLNLRHVLSVGSVVVPAWPSLTAAGWYKGTEEHQQRTSTSLQATKIAHK